MSDQEVNVVGDRAHLEQRSLLIFNNATQVSVEFITNIVGQCRFPVLRGEDQMHQDLGERLRHEFRPFRAPVLLGVNRWLWRCPSDPGRCPGLSHHAALRHLGARCVNAGWFALDIFAIEHPRETPGDISSCRVAAFGCTMRQRRMACVGHFRNRTIPGQRPGISHHDALRHLGARCVNAGWLALDIFAIGPSKSNARRYLIMPRCGIWVHDASTPDGLRWTFSQ